MRAHPGHAHIRLERVDESISYNGATGPSADLAAQTATLRAYDHAHCVEYAEVTHPMYKRAAEAERDLRMRAANLSGREQGGTIGAAATWNDLDRVTAPALCAAPEDSSAATRQREK